MVPTGPGSLIAGLRCGAAAGRRGRRTARRTGGRRRRRVDRRRLAIRPSLKAVVGTRSARRAGDHLADPRLPATPAVLPAYEQTSNDARCEAGQVSLPRNVWVKDRWHRGYGANYLHRQPESASQQAGPTADCHNTDHAGHAGARANCGNDRPTIEQHVEGPAKRHGGHPEDGKPPRPNRSLNQRTEGRDERQVDCQMTQTAV